MEMEAPFDGLLVTNILVERISNARIEGKEGKPKSLYTVNSIPA